jgi:hypothetical protein
MEIGRNVQLGVNDDGVEKNQIYVCNKTSVSCLLSCRFTVTRKRLYKPSLPLQSTKLDSTSVIEW